jgi:hypothetical protein
VTSQGAPPGTPSTPAWRLTRLLRDEEIGSRIYMQVRALQPEIYMLKDRHDQLMVTIISLAQKLEKAKYHVDRCFEAARDE